MMMLNTISGFLLLQATQGFLFESDKIFTVLTVVLIIFSGISFYLWSLDRKISRLEKQQKETETK